MSTSQLDCCPAEGERSHISLFYVCINFRFLVTIAGESVRVDRCNQRTFEPCLTAPWQYPLLPGGFLFSLPRAKGQLSINALFRGGGGALVEALFLPNVAHVAPTDIRLVGRWPGQLVFEPVPEPLN